MFIVGARNIHVFYSNDGIHLPPFTLLFLGIAAADQAQLEKKGEYVCSFHSVVSTSGL